MLGGELLATLLMGPLTDVAFTEGKPVSLPNGSPKMHMECIGETCCVRCASGSCDISR
jgi:hypothetical protein